MLTKVQKWGNSLALRIPKSFALDANISENTIVEIYLTNGEIIIKPLPTVMFSLNQLLAGVTDSNIHAETDTGIPVGKEAW